jgi:hypothetical protein
MAVRHKRKNSTGYTWQAEDLVEGQIGLNIADGTAHIKKANGDVVSIGGGGGSLQLAIATGSATLTTTTKNINWTSEDYDPNNLITVGSNGTFTISSAGTYLIELITSHKMTDPNNWRLINQTASDAVLKSWSIGADGVFGGLAFVHTITASNIYRFQNPNTGATAIQNIPQLKVTKIA